MTTPEEVLSAQGVAERFGVAERTVRRWISSGQLPATKAGRAFAIRAVDAEAVVGLALGRRASARIDEIERERAYAILEGRYEELRATNERLEAALAEERKRLARLEVLLESRAAA